MATPRKRERRSSSTTKGRPTKCTAAIMATIEELIRGGVGRESAARKAGIGVATFHVWMAKGLEGRAPYSEFRRRIEGASDSLQHEVASVLLDGLRSDNQHVATGTARWLAERLWPDVYGRRQEVRQTGPDGGPVQVEAKVTATVAPLFSDEQLREMSPEQLRAALAGLEEGPR